MLSECLLHEEVRPWLPADGVTGDTETELDSHPLLERWPAELTTVEGSEISLPERLKPQASTFQPGRLQAESRKWTVGASDCLCSHE